MKKLILFLSLLLATAVVSAQSELPSDDRTPRAPEENYKEFGGFLLDMGLMSVMPPHLPKVDLSLSDTGKDFNQLFRLNPDVTYSQGLSNVFTPFFLRIRRIWFRLCTKPANGIIQAEKRYANQYIR